MEAGITMKVLDDGHIYSLKQLGTDEEVEIKFVKRSGGAIQYDEECPDYNTRSFKSFD